jgi:hypothetical protein
MRKVSVIKEGSEHETSILAVQLSECLCVTKNRMSEYGNYGYGFPAGLACKAS